jgi:hypothetical protein
MRRSQFDCDVKVWRFNVGKAGVEILKRRGRLGRLPSVHTNNRQPATGLKTDYFAIAGEELRGVVGVERPILPRAGAVA